MPFVRPQNWTTTRLEFVGRPAVTSVTISSKPIPARTRTTAMIARCARFIRCVFRQPGISGLGLGSRFWRVEIKLHDVCGFSERPFLSVWTVDGNLTLVAEQNPVLRVHSEPGMVLDVSGHNDEPEVSQLDGPMPEFSRFNTLALEELFVCAARKLPFKLKRDVLPIREDGNPCAEQALLTRPEQRIDKPQQKKAHYRCYDNPGRAHLGASP